MLEGLTKNMPASAAGGKVALLIDRVRSSLFFIPMFFIIGGAGLALATLHTDSSVSTSAWELPIGIGSTVESSRAVLTTVAAATVSVAGIAFSIALLMFQLASSQYSPRVMHGLFRDTFNKYVMGFVVGTFTYCLVTLQATHDALSDSGDPFAPTISTMVAVVLGIASLNGNRRFHRSQCPRDGCRRDLAPRHCRHQEATGNSPRRQPRRRPRVRSTFRRRAQAHLCRGWLGATHRHRPDDASRRPGGTLQLESNAGRFATEGTAICTVWPAPEDRESFVDAMRDAVHLGRSRTLIEDVGYGLRQLVDVALRALSPGVNDPTTAQDAIYHVTAVLAAALRTTPEPLSRTYSENRRLLTPLVKTNGAIIDLTFDELRPAAKGQAAVERCIEESLTTLATLAQTDDVRTAIQRQKPRHLDR